MTVTAGTSAPPRPRTFPDALGRSRTIPAAKAPVKPAPRGAAPPRPKPVPLKPMRREAAGLMRKLAASVQQSHPDMNVHDHLRDAARQVEAGDEEGAQRHLRAAFFSLTPQSLHRSGLFTDDAHTGARQAMHAVHRHILLVKNIADADARNQEAIRRDSGDGDPPFPVPPSPSRPDPNAGYGPGANAQKPTVRQPPGDQALNAPSKADAGGSDPSVADPGGPQAKAGKQFATLGEAGAVLDLVGTGGWTHGWKPGGPTAADHDKAAKLHTQAAAKAKDPAAKAMHMKRAKAHTQIARKLRALTPDASAGLAYDWGDVLNVIEFSPQTAALEKTPALYGKPGGPGLYGVAGNKHSNYYEQVVKGLMTKRGMDKGRASAIAWGVLRKWAAGGGGVHPEVAAAASKALAGEAAASAKAHAHAVTWHDIDVVVDMATVLEFFNPAEARVPVGSATAGQFSAGGAAAPASGQQPAKGQQPARAPAKPLTAHQKHILAVAHRLKVSTAKAGLLVSAQNDRLKAAGLIKQRDALAKALASASGKVSTGQAGAKTAKTAKTKTTAPATAKTAAAAKPAGAKTSTAKPAAAKAATAKAPAAPAKAGSATAMKAQIASLNTQISQLLAAAATATAQASKMK